MFERFTDRSRRVLVLAQEEARLLGHSFIGTEHILLGLIGEGHGVAAITLDALGISLEAARETVVEMIGTSGTPGAGSPPFTPRAKKVLELSLRESLVYGHQYIGTEHLLLGLVREGEGGGVRVLASLGADSDRVRERVLDHLMGSASGRPSSGASRVVPTFSADELVGAAAALRQLRETLDDSDLADVPTTTRRLEGAIATLEALAQGRLPYIDDFS